MALVRELQRRVGNLLIRALVSADDDRPMMQLLQVAGRHGEIKDGLEHFQPYGLAFRVLPPDGDGRGAETVVLAIESDLRACLPAADRRHRPRDLRPGEVALYSDEDRGNGQCRLHFRRGRLVTIQCDTARVEADTLARIEADTIEIAATSRLTLDVRGHGEDRVYAGGAYRVVPRRGAGA